MLKRVCFVELRRNENGLYEGVQSLETACMRAYLKKYGVDSTVFIEDSAASLNDMADDILTLSDEILVFWVHEEDQEINRALIHTVLDYEEVEIFAAGDGIEGLASEVCCLGAEPEEELLDRMGLEKQPDIRLAGVSPYLDNIILSREIFRYGLWTGRDGGQSRLDSLGRELRFLKETYGGIESSQGKLLKFSGNCLQNREDFLNLSEMIQEVRIPYISYQIPVAAALLGQLSEEEIMDRVVLQIRVAEDLPKKDADLFSRLAKAGKVSEIFCDASLLEEGQAFSSLMLQMAQEYTIALKPWGSMESGKVGRRLLDAALEKTKQYYYTYFRGFVKGKMGLYTGVKTDGYVHHLDVEDKSPAVDPGLFNEMMSVNSSVFAEGLAEDTEKGLLSFDRNGIAHGVSKSFESYMSKAAELRMNPSNLIRIDGGKFCVNDLPFTSDSRVADINYREARERIGLLKEEEERRSEAVNLIHIETEEDYRLFLEDADRFLDSHRIGSLPLAYGCLQNACRFVGAGHCSIEKIPRLKVKRNGAMYLCDSSMDFGLKVDSLFELTQNCFAGREKLLSGRGCYSCPVQGMCSKCSELPSFMKDDFCNIMKKRSYVLDYVFLPHYLTGLKESIRGFREMRAEEIRISNEHMFNLTEDRKGSTAPYFPKFTACILWKDKYVLWSPATNKYYSVNEAFAFYIELLFRRVRISEAVEAVAEHCGGTSAEARKAVENMNVVLKKAGVLYREINTNA